MNHKSPYLFSFSLIDAATLFFLLVLFTFLLLVGNGTPYFSFLFILYALIFGIIWVITRLRKKLAGTRFINLMLFLYPVAIFLTLYESLSALLPYFTNKPYDAVIEEADKILLGVSPTLWLQEYTAPWLTEMMYIFYFIYFPLPLVLVIYLMAKKNYHAAEKAIFTLFICYYGAYICYFFIPVVGPKYFLESQYYISLNGLMFSEPIHALINFCEPTRLDCFPSLHAAILLVTLALAFRFQKKMFYYFLPVGTGIMFSLIYLRYHYFVDVLAGAAWAAAAIVISRWLYHKFHLHFSFHFR